MGSLSTRLRVRFPFGNLDRQASTLATSARWRPSGDLLPIATRAIGIEACRIVPSARPDGLATNSTANGAVLFSLTLPVVADADGDDKFENIAVTASSLVQRIGYALRALPGVCRLFGGVISADCTTWQSVIRALTHSRAFGNGGAVASLSGAPLHKSRVGPTDFNACAAVVEPAPHRMLRRLKSSKRPLIAALKLTRTATKNACERVARRSCEKSLCASLRGRAKP